MAQTRHSDLKLYIPGGKISGEILPTDEASCSSSPSSRLEVLAGKVVKFLLTYRGSDATNKDYGGIALHHPNISRAYLPKLTMELSDDVERCTKYIIGSEKNLPKNLARLSRINIAAVTYDEAVRDALTVKLEIITNTNELAPIVLKDTRNA